MKSSLKTISAFFLGILQEYLIDKAIGTFIISTAVAAVSFIIAGNPFGNGAEPKLAVTINTVFEVIGTASFIVAILSVIPAIIQLVKWFLNRFIGFIDKFF